MKLLICFNFDMDSDSILQEVLDLIIDVHYFTTWKYLHIYQLNEFTYRLIISKDC